MEIISDLKIETYDFLLEESFNAIIFYKNILKLLSQATITKNVSVPMFDLCLTLNKSSCVFDDLITCLL